MQKDIKNYHDLLSDSDRTICDILYTEINKTLEEAQHKIWHSHPVWFLYDNPIVGYHKLKKGIRLLFWSGQSFDEPMLKNEGKFKAAECYYNQVEDINLEDLVRWISKGESIQWDYKNIVKRKGFLIRLK